MANIEETASRLNKLLEKFSMYVTIEWSQGGDHIGPRFSRWTINRKADSIWKVIPVLLEQYVGSVSEDFTVFGVNPDGPLSLKECEPLASAIGSEFGIKTSLIMQMSSQGGR